MKSYGCKPGDVSKRQKDKLRQAITFYKVSFHKSIHDRAV